MYRCCVVLVREVDSICRWWWWWFAQAMPLEGDALQREKLRASLQPMLLRVLVYHLPDEMNDPQELVDHIHLRVTMNRGSASVAQVRTVLRKITLSSERLVDAADEPEVPMAVEVTDEFLQTLAHDFPALHSLCIRANCGDVTDAGVRTLLELCPKLRCLTLHMAHGD